MASRTVYSACFVSVYPAPDGAVWSVPGGYKAVVRDMTLWAGAAAGGTRVQVYELETNGVLWEPPPLVATQSIQWQGREVLEAGDTLVMSNGSGDVIAFRASGYLLLLP